MKQDQQDIISSILYRLAYTEKPAQHHEFNLAQMKRCVIRDVENLLNTRGQLFSVPDAFKEVNDSLIVYGIRDFTSQNPADSFVRQELRSSIEKTIKQFEPRLENLSVTLGETKKSKRDIVFRINALLVVHPAVEQVTFDTYFDINNGEYSVTA